MNTIGKFEKKKKALWKIPVFTLAALLLCTGLFFLLGWQLQLEVTGTEEQTVECFSVLDAPTASAQLSTFLNRSNGFPVDVSISGSVDTNRVGTYELRYSAHALWITKTDSRIVRVIDTVPPVITLVPDDREYILPGTEYDDPGYSAEDNVDGTITDRVATRWEGDTLVYAVSDTSGNFTEIRRDVNYDDPVPPEITLLGNAELEIPFGSVYEEPGFTAVDNLDGDLTEQVTVCGEVNRYQLDTYEIVYTVKDSYGNETSVTRKVTLTPLRQPDQVTPSGKIIYLTFDDGPSKYTQQLLDVLEKYNVKATFFVVNYGYTDMIGKEAAAGHSVGVHSKTHDYYTIYANEEAYFEDLNAMREIVHSQTGTYPTMIRFPGGSSNRVSSFNPGIMTRLTQAVTAAGYQYFDWNVSSGDAGLTTQTDVVYQNVIDGVSKHDVSIVLQHDSKGYSVDAVERIILWGLSNGYTFLPLTPSSPTAHHHLNN